jgi:hypothetical protein
VIVSCQISYLPLKSQTLERINEIHPFVDRVILLASEEEQSWTELKQYPKVEYYQEQWQDCYWEYVNKYLPRVKSGDWLIINDADEEFCKKLCNDLPRLVTQAEKEDVTLLFINGIDKTLKLDGTVEIGGGWQFKLLVFKYAEGMRYAPMGPAKKCHIRFVVPHGAKSRVLDKKYYYTHHRVELDLYRKSFRDVFCGGGGNDVGEFNPRWEPLKKICESLGLRSWQQLNDYLKKGNIDKQLLQWIRECQYYAGWDWEIQCFEALKYYKAIHPEELPEIPPVSQLTQPIISYGSPAEVMHYVEETYKNILGRHAETQGKQQYTKLILSGQIRREDLPAIFINSDEYKERFNAPLKV